jgi:predicted ATPase/DNA-binding XRE family transcriptional regulator
MMPFSELLKRHRLASGISQESLAERARISASAVSALERGIRRAPYRDTIGLLATALGLSAAEQAELEAAADRARGRQGRGVAATEVTHNLRERLTSFVGREEEFAAIEALLASHRLVTITGSGGVGKTRTAVEVARQLLNQGREEVWFVDLAPITDGTFVAGAVASVLDVPLAQVSDPLPSLAAGLRTRRMLLILDNCEHVIAEAAALCAAILRTCPDIVMLATSRERLDITGESVYRLPSLTSPPRAPATIEEARTYPALRLFMDRATAIESRLVLTPERLATAGEICRQLEGIPLAIELAATRLPTLGFSALNQRLKEHFVIAGGGRDMPRRQQTMLATIAWSYDLLSEQERVLLRRISIFSGGLTLEAAEAVCAGDSLAAQSISDLLSLLVDKSLLSVTLVDEHTRYAMLESVRAFGAEKLDEAVEFTKIARAHAAWLATVADRADERYQQVPRDRWMAEFGAEIDNARGALEWALNLGATEDAVCAGRIVGGLRGLWIFSERRVECRRWTEAALARIDASLHPRVVARVMRARIQSIDGSAVLDAVDRAIPLFERIGDRRGLISLHAHAAWEYGARGAFAEAERSIARAFAIAHELRMQHSRQYPRLLQARCFIRALAGRIEEAHQDFDDSSRLQLAFGEEDPFVHSYWEAFFAFTGGDVRQSAELLEACTGKALAQLRSPAGPLSELAAVRIVLGDLDGAEEAARDALELARFEQLDSAWRAILHLATLGALRGRLREAARLIGFIDAWCERKGGFRGYYERASEDVLISALGAGLASAEIAALAEEGSRLEFDQAVVAALRLGVKAPF